MSTMTNDEVIKTQQICNDTLLFAVSFLTFAFFVYFPLFCTVTRSVFVEIKWKLSKITKLNSLHVEIRTERICRKNTDTLFSRRSCNDDNKIRWFLCFWLWSKPHNHKLCYFFLFLTVLSCVFVFGAAKLFLQFKRAWNAAHICVLMSD